VSFFRSTVGRIGLEGEAGVVEQCDIAAEIDRAGVAMIDAVIRVTATQAPSTIVMSAMSCFRLITFSSAAAATDAPAPASLSGITVEIVARLHAGCGRGRRACGCTAVPR